MKILTITDFFPNIYNPIQGIFVLRRVRAINEFCSVKVIVPLPGIGRIATPQIVKDTGIDVSYIGYPSIPRVSSHAIVQSFAMLLPLFKVVNKLKKGFNFDIIQSFWAAPCGFAGALLGRVFRRPVVLTVHGSDVNIYTKIPILRNLVAYAFRHSTVIVTVSDELKRKVFAITHKNNIVTIYTGVDTKEFYPQDKDTIRMKHKIPPEKRVILFVGNLIPNKGLTYLLQAIQYLKKDMKDILLYVIGKGYDEAKHREETKKLGIEDIVTFLDTKAPGEIPEWINASDLVCLPSLSEGRSNICLEALACGRPVVGSAIPGISSVVSSPDFGILVPPTDSLALADALREVLTKRDWKVEKMVGYAQQFTWQEVGQRYLEVYQSILKEV